MLYHTIQGFRPVEVKENSVDQDRTVLRLCEGLIPYPQGALCAGPNWKLLWGKSALGTDIETALTGADAAKAHFVKVAKNGHTFLVCWSLQDHTCRGFFYVGGSSSNADLDSTGSVVITATTGTVYRDKDPDAEWFASPIAGRIILGNGVTGNDNLVWSGGAGGSLAVFGPASTPASPNTISRVRIPPCTVFRQHVNRSIFAAGNAAIPMRVWISDPPNAGETFVDGVRSLSISYIDVAPCGKAARITSLSVFQQYVTVHTDDKPVNLYGVDGSADGWKCQQSPSAANASAINPHCCGEDLQGDAAFYLGRDLEVYQDQAVRSGPFEKRGSRAIDIATEQGAGVWNKLAKRPILTSGYHTLYDRENRLFWMFIPNSLDERPALWVYNERTRTVAGPIRYPAAIVSTLISSLGAGMLAVITEAGECLYADLADIGEQEAEDLEAKGTALGAAYAIGVAAPTPVAGIPFVSLVVDTAGVLTTALETVGADTVGLATPLGPLATLTPASYTPTQFFNNAYLARFEFPWTDIGAPGVFKNFLEAKFSFERGSRAYVGVYAETDSGRTSGKWKGLIHGAHDDTFRVPLNLFGYKVRIRVVAVVFNAGRLLISDAKIGYAAGGAD